MEKVKITREQEEAYKLMLGRANYDAYRVLSDFISVGDKQFVCKEYEPLLSLTTEELSHVLNRWYEVELPFKVGDWYKYTSPKGKEEYLQIEEIVTEEERDRVRIEFTDGDWLSDGELLEFTEKVTESWKIMLLELGRETPEFKAGDKYSTKIGEHITVAEYEEASDFHIRKFVEDDVYRFYPVENSIEINSN